jgi:hypothetical protein
MSLSTCWQVSCKLFPYRREAKAIPLEGKVAIITGAGSGLVLRRKNARAGQGDDVSNLAARANYI